jgi:hypothetical protein
VNRQRLDPIMTLKTAINFKSLPWRKMYIVDRQNRLGKSVPTSHEPPPPPPPPAGNKFWFRLEVGTHTQGELGGGLSRVKIL